MTAKELRKARERLGLTIQELADLSGYSWSQVQRMEVGKRSVSDRIVAFVSLLKKSGTRPGR
jgi:predicted transcriptional regulator